MSYVIIIAIVIFIILSIEVYKPFSSYRKKTQLNLQNAEIIKVLLNLNEDSLSELFQLYRETFGKGAAYYARQTYKKWKDGKVRPNNQTYQRFLVHLPKVMNFDLKVEILRLLMHEYCPKDQHNLTVYTDDWETPLKPLVEKLIEKNYQNELPSQVLKKLEWLSEGEMQLAQKILQESQAEEGKIAVSMLRQEIANIENLLAETHLKPKVSHELKFPYGTITLNIKRR